MQTQPRPPQVRLKAGNGELDGRAVAAVVGEGTRAEVRDFTNDLFAEMVALVTEGGLEVFRGNNQECPYYILPLSDTSVKLIATMPYSKYPLDPPPAPSLTPPSPFSRFSVAIAHSGGRHGEAAPHLP